MKSVGEVMAIGRTFKQALGKGMRSLETGKADGAVDVSGRPDRAAADHAESGPAGLHPLRVRAGLYRWSRFTSSTVDRSVVPAAGARDGGSGARPGQGHARSPITREQFLTGQARRHLRFDARPGPGTSAPLDVRARRKELGVTAVFNRVDTCAAEFESFTPYLYSSYESDCEAAPSDRKKVMILGSGPNRIGQGIEFDYCCCHASFALQEFGVESIMVNCNPETVSTDYDTSDRLYFEPLTLEEVLNIYDTEKPDGVIVQFGGQTPLTLALPLKRAGVPIIGTDPTNIDLAEDRKLFGKLLDELEYSRRPPTVSATSVEERLRRGAAASAIPVLVRPELRAGRTRDGDRLRRRHRAPVHAGGGDLLAGPAGADRPVPGRRHRSGRGRAGGSGGDVLIAGIMEHIEEAGVHSGDSSCVLPATSLSRANAEHHRGLHRTSWRGR